MNLTCGVETADVLEVFFKWKKNFVKLPESNRVYTRGKGPHTSVLHLDDLRMIDMGIYQCIAMTTGRVGSTDSAEAYLTVTGELIQCFFPTFLVFAYSIGGFTIGLVKLSQKG